MRRPYIAVRNIMGYLCAPTYLWVMHSPQPGASELWESLSGIDLLESVLPPIPSEGESRAEACPGVRPGPALGTSHLRLTAELMEGGGSSVLLHSPAAHSRIL